MFYQGKKILAISSEGGHWIQLRRLIPAFDGHEVVFVTVNPAYRSEVGVSRFYTVIDATSWNKLRLTKMAMQILWIVLRERPDIVISTGAAPGYFGLLFGKFVGARTIWVDSIANVERLSLSGRLAGRYADLWLTQWPHLSTNTGPYFKGGVI